MHTIQADNIATARVHFNWGGGHSPLPSSKCIPSPQYYRMSITASQDAHKLVLQVAETL